MNLYPSTGAPVKKSSLTFRLFSIVAIIFILFTAGFFGYTHFFKTVHVQQNEYLNISGKIISKFVYEVDDTNTIPPLYYLVIQQPDNIINMFTVTKYIFDSYNVFTPVVYSYSATNNTIALIDIKTRLNN